MRVQEISSTILDENNKLKIKIKDLEFSLKVLNEEKSLIL